MATLALIAVAVIVLCSLHNRALASQRRTLEDRLDAQAQRHAQDLRRIIDASERERTEWHKTLQAERRSADEARTALLAQVEQERATAADERVQLLNRIKPDTFQPLLSQPDAVAIPPAVGFDDDDAFWRASESRDEMVERIEREMRSAKVST